MAFVKRVLLGEGGKANNQSFKQKLPKSKSQEVGGVRGQGMADFRVVIWSRGLFLSIYKRRLLNTVGGHGQGQRK